MNDLSEDKPWFELLLSLAGAKLTSGVEAALKISGMKLLGALLEIPEAWAHQKAQGLRDVGAAKSRFIEATTQKAVASIDPSDKLVSAIVSSFATDYLQKLGNKADVYLRTIDIAAETPGMIDAKPPTDAWLAAFSRFSETASSDDMKDTFARILSGEIGKQGSFSISTLRMVSEMDVEVAQSFHAVYMNSIDTFMPEHFLHDPTLFGHATAIMEFGLLNPHKVNFISSASDSHIFAPDTGGWARTEPIIEIQIVNLQEKGYLPGYQLTRAGLELFEVLTGQDKTSNLKRFLPQMIQQNMTLKRVSARRGDHEEVLYRADD